MSKLKDIIRDTLRELERLNVTTQNKAIKVKDIECEWSYQEDFDFLEITIVNYIETLNEIDNPTYSQIIENIIRLYAFVSAYSSLVTRADDLIIQYFNYTEKNKRKLL